MIAMRVPRWMAFILMAISRPMLFIQKWTRAVETVRTRAALPADPDSFLVGIDSPGRIAERSFFIRFRSFEKRAAWG